MALLVRAWRVWLAVCFVGVLTCVVAAGSGSSSAAPAGRWVVSDLLRLARQRYPAYVRVEPIGFGEKGEVLWIARENNAVDNPRRYTDGSLAHVFGWQDGKTRDLGSFGQSDNSVAGVNAHDQIAVTREVAPYGIGPAGMPPLPPPRAFLWQKGRFTSLGTLGGSSSFAVAINDNAQIVGVSETKESGRVPISHAFLWQEGKMIDLGTLGGRWSDASAINDRGQVVGSSQTRSGQAHAFLWQDGKMTDLGLLGGRWSEAVAINEQGQVIGLSATARSPNDMDQAFVWENGKMTDLRTRVDPDRITLAINNNGQIIGTRGTAASPIGFLWQNGKITTLGTLDGQTTIPTGINDHGQIVGGTTTATFRSQAFLWQNGTLTALPSLTRLASNPIVRIDPSGTRIVADSGEAAGLRRRVLMWTLQPG
jgi:probable HAF family extracellular repeat protein